jgi:hypothetical protein
MTSRSSADLAVQVLNTGTQTIVGPIYRTLGGLSTNAILANATGWTSRFVSVGTSYITVTTAGIAPGKKASVTLQFSSPTPVGALPGGSKSRDHVHFARAEWRRYSLKTRYAS